MSTEIKVPDLGGAKGVRVIELLAKAGDVIKKDQSLLVVEGDKATMEIPATHAGTLQQFRVALGDTVDEGQVIAVMDAASSAAPAQAAQAEAAKPAASAAALAPVSTAASAAAPVAAAPVAQHAQALGTAPTESDYSCDVAVLGSGPGGYTAAFRAADLGLNVILIERYPSLGGVCLNVGCIPSKALLHAARVIDEAQAFADLGISFGKPKIDLDKLRKHKDTVVSKLTAGLAGMSKQRKVTVLQGHGEFGSAEHFVVRDKDTVKTVRFKHAIIAAGSQAIKIPGMPWGDPRLMDSTDALTLSEIPKRLLVVGGGIIGLEMACVFDALGAKVSVVELMDQLMPGADPDLIKPLQSRIAKHYEAIMLKTKVSQIVAEKNGLRVSFEGEGAPAPQLYDRVLVSVGRSPNGKKIKADMAGVAVSDRGFISVDKQQRTNVPHIFAIGDIVGQPMLAHKATHEGKVAAEVAAGHRSEFVARVIPSVAYTDPEIAWVGVTESEAKARGIDYGKGVFPLAASGRAIGVNRTEGFTKLIFDNSTHRVIGAGIVAPNAGDLISEVALAIEMGCDAADIGLTIHPHPTLSESVGMAAEVFEGTITDLYVPKRK
jgi:dihydrolipoamide dehydrogenase